MLRCGNKLNGILNNPIALTRCCRQSLAIDDPQLTPGYLDQPHLSEHNARRTYPIAVSVENEAQLLLRHLESIRFKTITHHQ